eukprot:361250-Chlamydomonas_euryale.AAC.2
MRRSHLIVSAAFSACGHTTGRPCTFVVCCLSTIDVGVLVGPKMLAFCHEYAQMQHADGLLNGPIGNNSTSCGKKLCGLTT